jgi:hypothetical protein
MTPFFAFISASSSVVDRIAYTFILQLFSLSKRYQLLHAGFDGEVRNPLSDYL